MIIPVGLLTDTLAIALGGIIGTFLSNIIPKRISDSLFFVFSFCAVSIGINSFIGFDSLSVVIISLIIGTILGEVTRIDITVDKLISFGIKKLPVKGKDSSSIALLSTAAALFCFGCTGIYGSLLEGLTGDSTILIAKAILDFFTAFVFASKLGGIIACYSIPAFIFYFIFFLLATYISPLLTPSKIANFKGVGGVLNIIIGYNMLAGENNWKKVKVLNSLPAILIATLF